MGHKTIPGNLALKIRKLTAYAADNGQRTSDSKIVRAALRRQSQTAHFWLR
jgi:hypothetical protein